MAKLHGAKKARKSPSKPVTKLQLLSIAVNWFSSHSVQDLHPPWKLKVSQRTQKLLDRHKNLNYLIRDSIKADYEAQKRLIIKERNRLSRQEEKTS